MRVFKTFQYVRLNHLILFCGNSFHMTKIICFCTGQCIVTCSCVQLWSCDVLESLTNCWQILSNLVDSWQAPIILLDKHIATYIILNSIIRCRLGSSSSTNIASDSHRNFNSVLSWRYDVIFVSTYQIIFSPFCFYQGLILNLSQYLKCSNL